MFVAIMKTESGRVAKVQDPFDTLADAQAHVDAHSSSYPNAFAIAKPSGKLADWLVASDRSVSVSTLPTDPAVVRSERDELLAATDWEAIRALEALYLADTPLGIYRKALRDLPASADFPDTPMPTRQ